MERSPRTVAQAGEDAVLSAILEVITPHNDAVAQQHRQEPGQERAQQSGQTLAVGPGNDDAAVLAFSAQPSPGSSQPTAEVVMTTDTMSEGQDFRRRWWLGPNSTAEAAERTEVWAMDVGTKAAAQNLSDISAMGAVPSALLVSLTLPADLPVEWVGDFFQGMVRACRAPGAQRCVIAGGDLGSGDTISVTITALGQAEDAPVLRRSGAQPGDILAVAGPLGRAAAGFELLEHLSAPEHDGAADATEQKRLWESHEDLIRDCLAAQQRPEPPLTAGPTAAAHGATAAMDISDGLIRDAGRLASAAGVCLKLDDAALEAEAVQLEPVAGVLGRDPQAARRWVCAGGEEYALLATFGAGVVLPEGFRPLGEVLEHRDGVPRVITEHAVSAGGWSSL
ncbi:thiamine-monophosphate kinase [Nesterenkonia lacusekhoensis]|uniref:Thiamine-monophosphate kinase n=1 Tax=Nesterenkonia lacusekhoensis TaxID=150832 RepID=A0ABS4T1S8_9MICC|nr:thiamine-phosphate kinase [Nesterenkonia lacusekhoensis]MBP2318358.1 thiamine-monophosphate kinase [Nesterenkonia lacusekhoensis]